MKERQKQQLRHKALKKGLDPEALTGKYPPMIQVASKYERRVDTRSYDDKKKLFEGVSIRLVKLLFHFFAFTGITEIIRYKSTTIKGYMTQYAESKDEIWKTRQERFTKRKKG